MAEMSEADLRRYPRHRVVWLSPLPEQMDPIRHVVVQAADVGLSCGDRVRLSWDDSREQQPALRQEMVCPGALTGGCFVNVANRALKPR